MLDALRCDRAALLSLWADTFGDPPTLIEAFFELLPELGFGLAAVEGGRVLGAAYWIDALRLGDRRVGYLYAVAVRPDARGRGLGLALSRACVEKGLARGAAFACTEPAGPSLFDWYARIGLKPVLCRRIRELPAAPGLPLEPLSAEGYGLRREALLRGTPHVTLLPAALRFAERLLQSYGGGFFAVGDGVLAVEEEDGAALVREALGETPAALAAAAASHLGLPRAVLCESADTGERFLAGDTPFPKGTVWNLSFD